MLTINRTENRTVKSPFCLQKSQMLMSTCSCRGSWELIPLAGSQFTSFCLSSLWATATTVKMSSYFKEREKILTIRTVEIYNKIHAHPHVLHVYWHVISCWPFKVIIIFRIKISTYITNKAWVSSLETTDTEGSFHYVDNKAVSMFGQAGTYVCVQACDFEWKKVMPSKSSPLGQCCTSLRSSYRETCCTWARKSSSCVGLPLHACMPAHLCTLPETGLRGLGVK